MIWFGCTPNKRCQSRRGKIEARPDAAGQMQADVAVTFFIHAQSRITIWAYCEEVAGNGRFTFLQDREWGGRRGIHGLWVVCCCWFPRGSVVNRERGLRNSGSGRLPRRKAMKATAPQRGFFLGFPLCLFGQGLTCGGECTVRKRGAGGWCFLRDRKWIDPSFLLWGNQPRRKARDRLPANPRNRNRENTQSNDSFRCLEMPVLYPFNRYKIRAL